MTAPGRHHRFRLHDVRYGEVCLPSATLDRWEDADGTVEWIARVLVRPDLAPTGLLAGRLADGRHLSGPARVAGDQPGPGSRRERLIDLRGVGLLAGWTPNGADEA